MRILKGLVMVGLLSGLGAWAQDNRPAKDDMKEAGRDTVHATKKVGRKVKNKTKKGVNKAAGATERGADKVRSKTE